jgi:hypothetical protein
MRFRLALYQSLPGQRDQFRQRPRTGGRVEIVEFRLQISDALFDLAPP